MDGPKFIDNGGGSFSIGPFHPGERVAIVNSGARAVKYRVETGGGGAVLVTVAPGASLELILGNSAPKIEIVELSDPGLREV
jgi:hypothetical protein